MKKVCRTAVGWRDLHSPVNQPHPSIPNITRTVCDGCGKVLDWISLEERASRERQKRMKVSKHGTSTTYKSG